MLLLMEFHISSCWRRLTGGRYWKSAHRDTEGKDAEKLLESFRQGPLYVRYLPSKPKVYVCDPFRDVRP